MARKYIPLSGGGVISGPFTGLVSVRRKTRQTAHGPVARALACWRRGLAVSVILLYASSKH